MNYWLATELDKLDLTGRDDLYTHLILQEIPLWYQSILRGETIPQEEVDFLIKRRGFNAEEQEKFRNLAKLFNDNGEPIRGCNRK